MMRDDIRGYDEGWRIIFWFFLNSLGFSTVLKAKVYKISFSHYEKENENENEKHLSDQTKTI